MTNKGIFKAPHSRADREYELISHLKLRQNDPELFSAWANRVCVEYEEDKKLLKDDLTRRSQGVSVDKYGYPIEKAIDMDWCDLRNSLWHFENYLTIIGEKPIIKEH